MSKDIVLTLYANDTFNARAETICRAIYPNYSDIDWNMLNNIALILEEYAKLDNSTSVGSSRVLVECS